MKTPIIIALSIVGVLGTAGAAMAVNAGTLASFSQTHLGNAPTVLDPTATPTGHPTSDDPTSTATPEPSETAEPGEHSTPEPGDDSREHSTSPSPSPTHTESGDDHGDDGHGGDDGSGGHGSDD
jgi:hypothetical protein